MMHSAAEVEERVPPPVKASSPGAVPDGAGVGPAAVRDRSATVTARAT